VLAGDPAVVVHEEFHRVGQVNDFRLALHLDPLAEEAVIDDTQRCPGIATEVLRLDRGLAGADQHPPLVVDRAQHGGKLRAPIRPGCGENRPVMGMQELNRQVKIHRQA